MTRHRLVTLGAALLLAAPSGAARADDGIDRFWNDGNGGAFGDPFNWLDGQKLGAPAPCDTAIFDIGGDYTVGFLEPQVTDRVLVRSGLVTFDLGGATYDLLGTSSAEPSIVVGDATIANSRLTVRNGTVHGRFASLGRTATAFGTLRVGAGGTLVSDAQVHVGEFGLGILDVTDGGRVECASLVVGLSGHGTATVSGGASSVDAGSLTVGKGGFGQLTIRDGAAVMSQSLIVGQQLGSVGDLVVENATVLVDGPIDVGMVGHGRLELRGADLSSTSFAVPGAFASSFPEQEYGVGEVIVGDGSTWSIDGDLIVGFFGYGRWTLARGGRVVVGGELSLGQWSPSDGSQQTRLELGSSGDYPAAAISAALIDDLEVEVALVDDFLPVLGDTFAVADSFAPLGEVTFDLPPAPDGLRWHADLTSTTAALRLVHFADLDGDGAVNVNDLLIVLTEWGACDGCAGDLNGDGLVNVDDLVALLGAFE